MENELVNNTQNDNEVRAEGNIFALILGREQKIALAEFEAVMRRFDFYFDKNHPERVRTGENESKGGNYSILSLLDNVAIIKTEDAVNLETMSDSVFSQLGGTVSMYEILEDLELSEVENDITNDFIARTAKNFAISDYAGKLSVRQITELGIRIKMAARKNRSVRFVAGKEAVLNSATLYHKILRSSGEAYGLFKNEQDNVLLGRLIASSNPDDWSERDYDKPAGDKYSGMMPPKLARMLVNLALGQAISNNQDTRNKQIPNSNLQVSNIENLNIDHSLKIVNCKIENSPAPLVFDPFCGSGNVLIEALMLGCKVAGSDISPKAVEDTKANLNWLISNDQLSIFKQHSNIENFDIEKFIENWKLEIENSVFQADATTFDLSGLLEASFAEELKNRKTEEPKNLVIVTEPYLGQPRKVKSEKSKVESETEELKKLYLSFFKNLSANIQHSTFNIQSICFVFPRIETLDGGSVSLYSACVDELKKMGYNPIQTFIYGRDYQVVKREIVLFTINQ